MEHYDSTLAGDIILVTSQGKYSLVNRLWQRLTSNFKIDFQDIPSHIAICYGGVSVLHAIKMDGSTISSAADFFREKDYKNNFRAFRNIELEHKITTGYFSKKDIVFKIEKYWGQPYNFGVIVKAKSPNKKFCSEVAATFFQDIGVLDSTLTPSKIYPIDLMRICSESSKWREVTIAYQSLLSSSFIKKEFEIYKKQANNKDVHKEIDGMVDTLVMNTESFIKTATRQAEIEQNIKKMNIYFKKVDNEVKKASEFISEILKRKNE